MGERKERAPFGWTAAEVASIERVSLAIAQHGVAWAVAEMIAALDARCLRLEATVAQFSAPKPRGTDEGT